MEPELYSMEALGPKPPMLPNWAGPYPSKLFLFMHLSKCPVNVVIVEVEIVTLGSQIEGQSERKLRVGYPLCLNNLMGGTCWTCMITDAIIFGAFLLCDKLSSWLYFNDGQLLILQYYGGHSSGIIDSEYLSLHRAG